MRLALALVVAVAALPPAQDALDRPTDTGITLVPGLWHDDELTPARGWHLYHFTAEADGTVAFQMRARPGDASTLWSYLRIVDAADHGENWAGVGNRETNHCEILVEVVRGHRYDVIASSEQSALLRAGASGMQRNRSVRGSTSQNTARRTEPSLRAELARSRPASRRMATCLRRPSSRERSLVISRA